MAETQRVGTVAQPTLKGRLSPSALPPSERPIFRLATAEIELAESHDEEKDPEETRERSVRVRADHFGVAPSRVTILRGTRSQRLGFVLL
ncbi:hypothetical protein [Agromyces sp. H66]|uniref:hypothetical protein n=1 Tax=Agromyces sp. H66 TaxID=2529859 RepID=UPI0010AAE075|nr:hypothetical protein [Agromyces sp. H66]